MAYITYKQYHSYIKDKYDKSQQIYMRIFTDADNNDDFLFTYEALNVYPTFPAPIILNLKCKTDSFTTDNKHNITFNLDKISHNTSITNSKLKEFATYNDKVVELSGSEKIRRYFDYEIRDTIKQTYKITHVTNAWVKMYEILIAYPTLLNKVPKIDTFHICEHPGKFVFAIKDYITNNFDDSKKTSHSFIFQSLNPIVSKHGFKVDPTLRRDSTGKLDYGPNQTGDITDPQNIQHYISTYRSDKFQLLTSDCGDDFSDDYIQQEMGLYKVYLGAIITALGVSNPGSNYVFKLFTFSHIKTIELLYIVSMYYEQVDIVRPMTTKGNSSEIYCVCQNLLKSVSQSDIDKLISYLRGEIPTFVTKFDPVFIDRINKYHELLMMRRVVAINQLIFRMNNYEYATNNPLIREKIKLYVDYYTNYFINYIRIKKN